MGPSVLVCAVQLYTVRRMCAVQLPFRHDAICRDWLPYLSTFNEAEFPSGAVCWCTVVNEWIELWQVGGCFVRCKKWGSRDDESTKKQLLIGLMTDP